jgi:hypothetical protein
MGTLRQVMPSASFGSKLNRFRRPIGWVLLALFGCLGLWLANLWLYHAWAGSGPPVSPEPAQWQIMWSRRFFWLALTSVLVGVVCLWRSRARLAA